jgi:hypothetical protein
MTKYRVRLTLESYDPQSVNAPNPRTVELTDTFVETDNFHHAVSYYEILVGSCKSISGMLQMLLQK